MSDSLYVPKAQYEAMKTRLEESEKTFKRAFSAATNWLEYDVSRDAYSTESVIGKGYTVNVSARLGLHSCRNKTFEEVTNHLTSRSEEMQDEKRRP